MKILLLAPQPFFFERGTPIAVNLLVKTLSQRCEEVDILTYHLGKDVQYPGVTITRVPRVPFIREVSSGFSAKKVVLDLLMAFTVFRMVLSKRYDVVHAVEESVFIAMLLKFLFKIPYVYDMDSSLSHQLLTRYPRMLRPFAWLLTFLEGRAIRGARAVVPVCEALSIDIQKYRPENVVILHDVSLLGLPHIPPEEDLRQQLDIQGLVMMYVGNLEPHQGIDLLLDSFALAVRQNAGASLVVIGGKSVEVESYREKAQRLGLNGQVHFLGPKPLEKLADYLAQADILVSPRIMGKNTPMKIYSYLDSGKALLATDLPTHTQVLTNQVALLADPNPQDFSQGVLRLVEDAGLRRKLGLAGKRLVEERHTYEVFRNSLNMLYDWLDAGKGSQPLGRVSEWMIPQTGGPHE